MEADHHAPWVRQVCSRHFLCLRSDSSQLAPSTRLSTHRLSLCLDSPSRIREFPSATHQAPAFSHQEPAYAVPFASSKAIHLANTLAPSCPAKQTQHSQQHLQANIIVRAATLALHYHQSASATILSPLNTAVQTPSHYSVSQRSRVDDSLSQDTFLCIKSDREERSRQFPHQLVSL